MAPDEADRQGIGSRWWAVASQGRAPRLV